MARPRVLKLPNKGEIVLRNVDPAVADKIQKAISDLKVETSELAEEVEPKNVAVGVAQVDNSWGVVRIKFDAATKTVKFESFEKAANKYDAGDRFKIIAAATILV